MKTEKYTLPSFWACALINNDESGMNDEDIIQLNKWIETHKRKGRVFNCINADVENTSIEVFKGILNDVCEFTFDVSSTAVRTIDKIITNLSCKYGAPMGRGDKGVKPTDGTKIFDCAVPMCDGAYDRGGAYWGLGNQLRVAYTKDLCYIHFYRLGEI